MAAKDGKVTDEPELMAALVFCYYLAQMTHEIGAIKFSGPSGCSRTVWTKGTIRKAKSAAKCKKGL